ncbi:MAG: hypothetical protein M0T81_00070 [Thermoplasmatales archaeon]|nr:hypothetical protein [Thermoplasmatales archaeon]
MVTGSDSYSGNPLSCNFASNHNYRDDPEVAAGEERIRSVYTPGETSIPPVDIINMISSPESRYLYVSVSPGDYNSPDNKINLIAGPPSSIRNNNYVSILWKE